LPLALAVMAAPIRPVRRWVGEVVFSAVVQESWWAAAECHGRHTWTWPGPERLHWIGDMEGVVRLHRIGDMEGVVRRRHPLRGGALCRLDPI
jgi:hypothetical protein